jgi:hypothetical protein
MEGRPPCRPPSPQTLRHKTICTTPGSGYHAHMTGRQFYRRLERYRSRHQSPPSQLMITAGPLLLPPDRNRPRPRQVRHLPPPPSTSRIVPPHGGPTSVSAGSCERSVLFSSSADTQKVSLAHLAPNVLGDLDHGFFVRVDYETTLLWYAPLAWEYGAGR